MTTPRVYLALALALVAAGCSSRTNSATAKPAHGFANGTPVHAHGLLLVQTCPVGTADGDVYVVDAATGRKRFLVRAAYTEEPQWSPDGRRILVSVAAHGRRDLWAYALRGGAPRNLTRMRGWEFGGRWSPEATSIAFLVQRGGSSADLYVRRLDGGPPRLVVRRADAVAWSRDQTRIAFAPEPSSKLGRPRIWSVAAGGGRPRPLGGDGTGSVESISWGRDALAYTSGGAFFSETHLLRGGTDRKLGDRDDVQFLANGSFVFARGATIVLGDGRRVKNRLPSRAVAPTWSPDATYVAYASWHLDELDVARADGSGPRPLHLGLQPICNIAWQPFPWVA